MNPATHTVPAQDAGQRLDTWLVSQLENVSRARVQLLLSESKVLVDGAPARPSLKLRGGEVIEITGEATPPPLRATPRTSRSTSSTKTTISPSSTNPPE